ncbi:ATP-dependent RNA helicase DbpA [Arcobacter sp. LA11]|uniref:ATP-dependent RNA helicase DbpA n=1 Tax=Arcobacter sp. LA11 TaxID=1898176 RepID=UPI000934BFD8|nr:ATP-dependent RNA helicase DbpA [Arcobacter sp. LA11]
MSNLKDLEIPSEFKKNLETLGFSNLTSIQEKSLPSILDGKDVVGQAKTGSGKTLAFSIPIVNALNVKKFRIQSIVLAPTRELANQIAVEIRKLSRHIHNVKVLTLCGGVPFKPQVASLNHGAHIVVGTPGRILQHIHETKVDFSNVNMLVLDEADKMLDMGFYEDILKIIENVPQYRQSLLFSATYEDNIKKLSNEILNKPIFVQSEAVHTSEVINQKFYSVTEEVKTALIPSLISSNKSKSVLIFCNTKIKCDELTDDLLDLGLDVLTLHSDLDQRDRDETIILFSNKSYPILIATDVASRGLHIDDIDLVINYDVARNEMVHTHRIGRTARAGKNGLAVTLATNIDDNRMDLIKEKFDDVEFEDMTTVVDDMNYKIDSDFRSIFILGGKKQKVRAGDILGALTAGVGLDKNDIGKINILDFVSYVAVKKEVIKKAVKGLERGKIKGKYFKVFEK